MSVKVTIPGPLRQYTGGSDNVIVEGQTVAEAMRNLTARHGDLNRHLFNESGKLRSFVNVYRNDEDIRYLQGDNTPVTENDTLSIVPSIAGGAEENLQ
jgi:molybdopterin converting factor small subunit